MPFFKNAKGVEIYNATFEEIHGDAYQYIDQSLNVIPHDDQGSTNSFNGSGAGYHRQDARPRQPWPRYDYNNEPMDASPHPHTWSAPPRQQRQPRNATMGSDFDMIYQTSELPSHPSPDTDYHTEAQYHPQPQGRYPIQHPFYQSDSASEPTLIAPPRVGISASRNPFAQFRVPDAPGAGGRSPVQRYPLSGRIDHLSTGKEAERASPSAPQFLPPNASDSSPTWDGDSMYIEDRPRPSRSPIGNASDGVQEGAVDDQTANAIVVKIMEVIDNDEDYRRLTRVQKWKAQRLVDISQAVLERPSVDALSRRKLVVAMQRFSKHSSVYPRSYRLEGINIRGNSCLDEGAFGKVYRGIYQGNIVCLKALKEGANNDNKDLIKALGREAIMWRQLNHPNILPFYGICELDIGICLVSPWMLAGNLREYAKGPIGAERRLLIARDIANGLEYLHSHDVIHGDLKGANVLIDSVGRARIADFGLTSVDAPEIAYWTSQPRSTSTGGTAAYQAPEILMPVDDKRNTCAGDVYAWGITCYELYTSESPFKGDKDLITIQKLRGDLPSRPLSTNRAWTKHGLTERLWALMAESWSTDPTLRPTAHDLVERLNGMIDEDPRGSDGIDGEPERMFLTRWCRNLTEDERIPGGNRELFLLPTLNEVEELLKLS